jgi:hypothetical protein
VEDSLYNKMEEKGYSIRIWPSEMPEDPAKYYGRLAPWVENCGLPVGAPLDPARFDTEELIERRIEYGSAGYALQFMLDTTPSAANLHPLKCRDFAVMDIDVDVAPDFVVWSGGDAQTMEYLPNVGLHGDRFQEPMKVSEDFSPYVDTLMYIDPSGRGKDQTAYCVIKMLNGMVFLYDWGAFQGGFETKTLTRLATIARDAKCHMIVVETNFGDGMFEELLKPIVAKVIKFKRHDGDTQEGCAIESHRATGQKEVRAIETLEPVLAGHRMIIDTALVKRITITKDRSTDPDAALKSGFFQLTRLTKERGCLKFDDWIDCLSGAVRFWTERMGLDINKEAKIRKAERLDDELQKFIEGIKGPSSPKTWTSNLTKDTP